MTEYYLAIDIGASSGRHILGHMNQGKMVIEEIHRFSNEMINKNGQMYWDLDHLFYEILEGMKRCKAKGKVPISMGIDTWGVDFVLLDKNEQIIGEPIAYRDNRTDGMDEIVYSFISEKELYNRTGIQKQSFNTIYQLMAVKTKTNHLETAEHFLMIPDYFHYMLTGNKSNEYTNATTTQLVSPITKEWDSELLAILGIKNSIFKKLEAPGSILGKLSPDIQMEVGFDCRVVLPATHDTGSAVIAVPSVDEHDIYLSSGTWSLMGIEQMTADCSEKSASLNFTNEGGYNYRFRYLKNIMGLWMIQSIKREYEEKFSFSELCTMAHASDIDSLVDCNSSQFLAPESMIKAVRFFCAESGQKVPCSIGETAEIVYRSLAYCYKKTMDELEDIMGQTCKRINIVGGGANASYLNQLTAEVTGKSVFAGPIEATAIGNLTVQMITAGEFLNQKEARKCIAHSFEINIFEPLGGKK